MNIPVLEVHSPETVPVDKLTKELAFVEHSIKATKKSIKETRKRLRELESHLIYEKGIKSALEDMIPVPTVGQVISFIDTETGMISPVPAVSSSSH